MYPNSDILFNQAVKEVLPSINDHHNFKVPINYNYFIIFTGMIWISQDFLKMMQCRFDTDILL